jgi:hypothetical protein
MMAQDQVLTLPDLGISPPKSQPWASEQWNDQWHLDTKTSGMGLDANWLSNPLISSEMPPLL